MKCATTAGMESCFRDIEYNNLTTNVAYNNTLSGINLTSSSWMPCSTTRQGITTKMHSEETFTGFKWIGKIASERPDLRLVLGYEQALGYLVAQRPLDKDGIAAAVLMAEIAGVAAADGVTLQDRLDSIADRFGRYVTAELSVKMPPAEGAAWVAAIEADPAVGYRWAGRDRSDELSRGRPRSADARGRCPTSDPPQRHRTQGQALRRSRRPRSFRTGSTVVHRYIRGQTPDVTPLSRPATG